MKLIKTGPGAVNPARYAETENGSWRRVSFKKPGKITPRQISRNKRRLAFCEEHRIQPSR